MAKQAQHPSAIPSQTSSEKREDDQASIEAASTSDVTRAGSRLGELLGFSPQGYPVIARPGHEGPIEVPTTVALGRDDVGSVVLLTFVEGREDQPLVTGRLQPPLPPETPPPPGPGGDQPLAMLSADGPLQLEANGEVVTIEAERELVLRCGKASLRLRRDGFVELRGVDVVSRASRANWIRGGSVALN